MIRYVLTNAYTLYIGGEHTAKNIMISAVRRPEEADIPEGKELMKTRVLDLMSSYGIKKHRLAEWTGYSDNIIDE